MSDTLDNRADSLSTESAGQTPSNAGEAAQREAAALAAQAAAAGQQVPAGAAPEAEDIDAEVERHMREAQGQSSMEQIVSAQEAQHQADDDAATPHEFEYTLKRGRVSAIRGDDVFVELAGMDSKNQGIVPLDQFERAPRVGSIMDFVVERINEEEGLIILSREGAVTQSTWAQLKRGSVVEARVVASNKGGLELEMVGGISAFMPASQVDLHHVESLDSLIGEKVKAMVQEIERKSKKVVLSRRRYLEHERQMLADKLWAELEVDQVREGKVRSVVDFGAFVDLGGVDGMIHISDLSYTRINKPTEAVKVGDTVKVKVLKLDREGRKIKLGLKQVEPDPWEGIQDRVKVGETVSGRVVRLADFGAFIEVGPGLEGLLPISEASWKRINHIKEVIKQGDIVRVQVLAIEPEKHRLTLSLKAAQGDPWAEAGSQWARGSLVEGTVVRITDFGAFVELQTGVEGLVHISELSDRRVKSVDEVLKAGDRREFRVLDIDLENRRIRLSLKAVTAPPAESAATTPAAPPRPAVRRPARALKGGLE